jgi:hypothetical protein
VGDNVTVIGSSGDNARLGVHEGKAQSTNTDLIITSSLKDGVHAVSED